MRSKTRWIVDESFERFVDEHGMRVDGTAWDRAGVNCFGYVAEILRDCRWQRRNGKPLSEKSKTEYGNAILASFTELKELGYGLKKPWNLESQHVEALCRLWASRGLSAATVQNRLTSLSWLGALMSRPGLVRGTHSYDEQFGDVDMCRHQAATRDKSPEGSGFDRDEVIRAAMATDETFGYMVMLQFATGMRNKEAIRARPLVDDCGDHWKLPSSVGGSKGGRARIIPLEQGTWQREALDLVKAFVRRKGKGKLKTPMGWSNGKAFESANCRICSGLKSDMTKYKSLLEKCKFTRRQLGFSGHGMRHSFAHEGLRVHGYIPAIKSTGDTDMNTKKTDDGSSVTSADRESIKAAQLAVSESLGHSRIGVTSAYYGKTKYAKAVATESTKPD